MQTQFRNGDVVYLNSGSPKLTVIDEAGRYSPTPSIEVSWVNDAGEAEYLTAPVVCFRREE
jgi:uncharacterized protein YodC (DUF2158 family)